MVFRGYGNLAVVGLFGELFCGVCDDIIYRLEEVVELAHRPTQTDPSTVFWSYGARGRGASKNPKIKNGHYWTKEFSKE